LQFLRPVDNSELMLEAELPDELEEVLTHLTPLV
jgi:hypothetical protein